MNEAIEKLLATGEAFPWPSRKSAEVKLLEKLVILETAFRKCLADKHYIGNAQHKLTLDSEAVTESFNRYVQQAIEGWQDHPHAPRHEK